MSVPQIDMKHKAAGLCSFEAVEPPMVAKSANQAVGKDVEDISKNVNAYLTRITVDGIVNHADYESTRVALETNQKLWVAIATAICVASFVILIAVSTVTFGAVLIGLPLFYLMYASVKKSLSNWDAKAEAIKTLDLRNRVHKEQYNATTCALLTTKNQNPKNLPFVQFMQTHFANKPNVHGEFTADQLVKMHNLFVDGSLEKEKQIAALLKEIRLQQLMPVLAKIIKPTI